MVENKCINIRWVCVCMMLMRKGTFAVLIMFFCADVFKSFIVSIDSVLMD